MFRFSLITSWPSSLWTSAQWMLHTRLLAWPLLADVGDFFLKILNSFMLSESWVTGDWLRTCVSLYVSSNIMVTGSSPPAHQDPTCTNFHQAAVSVLTGYADRNPDNQTLMYQSWGMKMIKFQWTCYELVMPNFVSLMILFSVSSNQLLWKAIIYISLSWVWTAKARYDYINFFWDTGGNFSRKPILHKLDHDAFCFISLFCFVLLLCGLGVL